MSHLAPLIADLALILICAGIMTLLFKKLKQPLVLGYVVAGFLASPHMAYTPSVMDTANIQTWADRKSTRLNSSHANESRMPSSA